LAEGRVPGLTRSGRLASSPRKGRATAKLIYNAISSLDGYIEDVDGKFDWAEPNEEVHAFVNDLVRPVGTYLLGRRMYETMVYWERPPDLAAQSGRAGLRRDLAEGREDRVLKDAAGSTERQDADRARVRPGSCPTAEGNSRL
jgi:dihydrofolate reductase